ncbi:MAG: M50 family metallopeptidase [Pseudonocardiales bacterium]|nr:M50 family metallopeptidase [Pseudonocardiales bacterium]
MIAAQTAAGSSIAGAPVVYGTGVIIAVLVALPATTTWVGSLVTVAHEGGHVVLAILSGRGPRDFKVHESTGGGVTEFGGGWGSRPHPGVFVGDITPPMLGLAGAYLVLAGHAWSLLWAAIVLLLAAWAKAMDFFTGLVVLLAGVGIGWVAVRGSPDLQTGLAVALVWLMPLGGVRSLADLRLGSDKSDSGRLAHNTWIPRVVWVAIFWFVAIVCLAAGGARLLGL